MKKSRLKVWLILLAAVVMAAGFGMKARADSPSIMYDTDNFHDGTVGQYYEATAVFYCYATQIKECMVTGTIPPGTDAVVDKARSWIVLKGTPTVPGEYSFGLTAISDSGKSAVAMHTVRIASAGTTYTVNTTYCSVQHQDGTVNNQFKPGELVKITNYGTLDLYPDSFTTTPSLTVPTGYPGERVFGIPENSFYMPAQNVSVKPVLKNKDLGTYNHDADAGDPCGYLSIASMDFAIDHDLIWADLDREAHEANAANQGDFLYFYVDLDKDGSWDLEMTQAYGKRWSGGGYAQAMRTLPGRSVYGYFTVSIPIDKLYKDSDTGLYSKIVLYMGVNTHTHSFKAVGAKDATCTSAGVKAHYECACGQWAWDDKGTNKISNHADVNVKALGHDMKVVANKAATCTEDGNMWHCECSRCGNWYWDTAGNNLIPATGHDYLIIKATGHKWGEWKVTKAPTTEANGEEVRTCLNDPSHTETRQIPQLPAPETTEAPTEPPTEAPTTEAPTTAPPATQAPTEPPTQAPTAPPETQAPATQAPETKAPETQASATQAPETQAPATQAPETQAPTPEKGGSNNTWLYILIGLLLAACGVLGGILIGKKKQNGE